MSLQAVTLAIRDQLMQALHPTHIPADSFSVYVGPPDAGRTDDELILFLLRINPNAELRNSELARPGASGADAALPLDLHYLVTAGSPANTTSTESLTRLGQAIQAIEAASPLSVDQDAVWLSLEPMTTDELSRIWGLFPNYNCRSSFLFRAGPVWLRSGRTASPAMPVRMQGAA